MIDILLATYNGAQFLDAQLQSLERQTYQNFRIYILDDGSTDRTPEILRAFQARHPDQTILLPEMRHTGSPSLNFFHLLEHSTQDYTMFCDQDDIWAEEKIRVTLQAMQRQEEQDPAVPRLVHTDLEVVSTDLTPIAQSFMRYQHLDPYYVSLPGLIVQNNVTGCTVLMNRHLRELIRQPDPVCMYDWWIALSASAFGRIAYLKDATVLYRQHGANAVGAQDVRTAAYAAEKLRHPEKMTRSLQRTYQVAETFRRLYSDRLSASQLQFLQAYETSAGSGVFKRAYILSKYKAYKKGLGRRIAQIFLG